MLLVERKMTKVGFFLPSVYSRTLLFTEADEFGNIIDPETGRIVSERGGLTPAPPYPWSLKTPAFLSALTNTHYSTSHHTPPHSDDL